MNILVMVTNIVALIINIFAIIINIIVIIKVMLMKMTMRGSPGLDPVGSIHT